MLPCKVAAPVPFGTNLTCFSVPDRSLAGRELVEARCWWYKLASPASLSAAAPLVCTLLATSSLFTLTSYFREARGGTQGAAPPGNSPAGRIELKSCGAGHKVNCPAGARESPLGGAPAQHTTACGRCGRNRLRRAKARGDLLRSRWRLCRLTDAASPLRGKRGPAPSLITSCSPH